MDKKELAAQTFRSFDSMSAILGWILGLVKQEFPDFTLEGKRALEIGTGQFMNHPFGLYICGCKEVVTVDKDKLCEDPGASMRNIVLARRFLSPFVSHDAFMRRLSLIEATEYDWLSLVNIGIDYRMASRPFLDVRYIGRPPDFIFSYTTLEHISRGELVLDLYVPMLAPGGICVHFVDLEDHRNPKEEPFAFLSESAKARALNWAVSENRLRFSEWQKLFGQYDMDIRYPYVATRHDRPLPPKIDPSVKYTSEEDLRTTAFLMVGRK